MYRLSPTLCWCLVNLKKEENKNNSTGWNFRPANPLNIHHQHKIHKHKELTKIIN